MQGLAESGNTTRRVCRQARRIVRLKTRDLKAWAPLRKFHWRQPGEEEAMLVEASSPLATEDRQLHSSFRLEQ
jgi:hypothetical protein